MKENSLAKRYAKAIIETIETESEYNKVRNDVNVFISILNSQQNLRAGMETFLFSKEQKSDIFKIIERESDFEKRSLNFLREIMDENRIPVLEDIYEEMENVWYEKAGIVKYIVHSAVELNKKLEDSLKNNLEKSLNKKVVLEKRLDTDLIAGIKLQKGSVFYDFSVEGNLVKLYDVLTEESFGNANNSGDLNAN